MMVVKVNPQSISAVAELYHDQYDLVLAKLHDAIMLLKTHPHVSLIWHNGRWYVFTDDRYFNPHPHTPDLLINLTQKDLNGSLVVKFQELLLKELFGGGGYV